MLWVIQLLFAIITYWQPLSTVGDYYYYSSCYFLFTLLFAWSHIALFVFILFEEFFFFPLFFFFTSKLYKTLILFLLFHSLFSQKEGGKRYLPTFTFTVIFFFLHCLLLLLFFFVLSLLKVGEVAIFVVSIDLVVVLLLL